MWTVLEIHERLEEKVQSRWKNNRFNVATAGGGCPRFAQGCSKSGCGGKVLLALLRVGGVDAVTFSVHAPASESSQTLHSFSQTPHVERFVMNRWIIDMWHLTSQLPLLPSCSKEEFHVVNRWIKYRPLTDMNLWGLTFKLYCRWQ